MLGVAGDTENTEHDLCPQNSKSLNIMREKMLFWSPNTYHLYDFKQIIYLFSFSRIK